VQDPVCEGGGAIRPVRAVGSPRAGGAFVAWPTGPTGRVRRGGEPAPAVDAVGAAASSAIESDVAIAAAGSSLMIRSFLT
jgi:hypothetical protein